jgi:hypothetical protein
MAPERSSMAKIYVKVLIFRPLMQELVNFAVFLSYNMRET